MRSADANEKALTWLSRRVLIRLSQKKCKTKGFVMGWTGWKQIHGVNCVWLQPSFSDWIPREGNANERTSNHGTRGDQRSLIMAPLFVRFFRQTVPNGLCLVQQCPITACRTSRAGNHNYHHRKRIKNGRPLKRKMGDNHTQRVLYGERGPEDMKVIMYP